METRHDGVSCEAWNWAEGWEEVGIPIEDEKVKYGPFPQLEHDNRVAGENELGRPGDLRKGRVEQMRDARVGVLAWR